MINTEIIIEKFELYFEKEVKRLYNESLKTVVKDQLKK